MIGFDDAKDPDRVADRRDANVDQRMTIFDNCGTCQHASYCTNRLPAAFDPEQEQTSLPVVAGWTT